MPPPDFMQHMDAACQLIAAGRTLARRLNGLLRDTKTSETEFRLLWLLGNAQAHSAASDQWQLATQLGISPAQVSGLVEGLRQRGLLQAHQPSGDRRRQCWQLAPAGRTQLDEILTRLAQVPDLLPSFREAA